MAESLFRPNTIGEIIAERTFLVVSTSNEADFVKVLLGRPEKLPDGPDFYCPFQIVGLGPAKVRCAFGIDGFQVIQLAMTAVGGFLKSLCESEGRQLRWEGDDGGDLGFPSVV
jgi:hypothetical protein